MAWARDNKPRLAVAAARNPDGSWGLGISDYTADDFPRGFWCPGKKAQSFSVTVKFDELAKAGELNLKPGATGRSSRAPARNLCQSCARVN